LDRITPPTDLVVNEPRTILLPGRADRVAVGGGGRYIVLTFPAEGRLEVFDANTGGLLAGTDLPKEHGRLLAAGANKVVVKTNQGKRFRVYSLPDLVEGREFELTGVFDAVDVAIGSRTNGPLIAADPFGFVQLVDLTTGTIVEGSPKKLEVPNHRIVLSATADGKLFFGGSGYGQRDKFKLFDERDQNWRVRETNATAAYISPDGQKFYALDQILSANGTQLAGKPTGVRESVWYVPAVTSTGDYFLSVYERKRQFPRTKDAVVVTLLKGTNVSAPVVPAWDGLPETERLASTFFNAAESLDEHLFLIPEAKLFVILNKDRTRLVVRKLNI
jgi:hypothetical protein